MSEQLLLLSVGPSRVVPAWVLLQQPTALFSWSLGSKGAPQCSTASWWAPAGGGNYVSHARIAILLLPSNHVRPGSQSWAADGSG